MTTYWSESIFIIVMIRWAGLAPWEFEFPLPCSSLIITQNVGKDGAVGRPLNNVYEFSLNRRLHVYCPPRNLIAAGYAMYGASTILVLASRATGVNGFTLDTGPPHTLHPTPYTPHPAPYTLHPTPNTLHPSPYTFTPYTLHPTPYILHPIPNTLMLLQGGLL